MANNRYFLMCDCGGSYYLGKSLGDGIYDLPTNTPARARLDEMSEWMWAHLMECEHPATEPRRVLDKEWAAGRIFEVVTEYDKRLTSDITHDSTFINLLPGETPEEGAHRSKEDRKRRQA